MIETNGSAAARKHTDSARPTITVRRPDLSYDSATAKRWLHGGAATLVAHALSPMFPAGERFFIKSVMAFKDDITDPKLQEEMRRFAAQEAAHTKAHQAYDTAVSQHYDLEGVEEQVQRDLSGLWKFLSGIDKPWFRGKRVALAVTVGLEHFTALLGHQVLSQQDFLEGVDREYASLWSWHAAEEVEHKAVAFDVYEAVGGHWTERCLVQVIATTLMVFAMFSLIAQFLAKDGMAFRFSAWRDVLGFLFVRPGVFSKAIPAYLDYYRPGFHPWDHDDRELLESWRQAYPSIAAARHGEAA
jgi:hypothetical protein